MNLYAVGDVQGCAAQLNALRHQVGQIDHDPHWFFVGDLINRGPRSLDTLRCIRDMGPRAQCVLGNHDLHLLAVASGARKPGRSDTIDDILQANDRSELLDWLRHQPLARWIDGHLLIHAGVLPQWNIDQVLSLAAEVEAVLQGPDWREFLCDMYGNAPERWDDRLRGIDRLRCIVNALTRLRVCRSDGSMQLQGKAVNKSLSEENMPWFDLPERQTADVTVVFGHWSAQGLLLRPNLIGLDSGCVWGGKLSAVRLNDRALFQVACPQFQAIGE